MLDPSSSSELPAIPGKRYFTIGEVRDLCRTFPNQTEVQVVGRHFAQEDSPDEIGAALAAWIPTLARR